jgi:putrescine importer
MMLTAISYARMSLLYPRAGSAYSYAARSITLHLGFLAGWAMFLDYLVIPLISAIKTKGFRRQPLLFDSSGN